MSWFRRRSPAEPADGGEDADAPAPETHASLALGEVLAGWNPDRRLHALDLGPAVGPNITFLTDRFLSTVEVVDLHRSLPSAAGDDPARGVAAAVPESGQAADLVLAWDLFNYLERDQVKALSTALAQRCRPGAVLFTMIYTTPQMPRDPGTFPLGAEEDDEERIRGITLTYRVDRSSTRPCPRYRPADVDAMTPDFEVDRNYLLRHGVQEYLLQRRAG